MNHKKITPLGYYFSMMIFFYVPVEVDQWALIFLSVALNEGCNYQGSFSLHLPEWIGLIISIRGIDAQPSAQHFFSLVRRSGLV